MPDPSIFEPDPLDEQALLTQLGGAPVSPVESLDQNLKRARLKALTAQALKRAEQAANEFVGPIEPEPMSVKLNTGGLGHVPQPTAPKIPLGQQPDPGPQLMVGPQEDRLTAPKIPLPNEPPPVEPLRASAMNMLSAPYTTLSGAVGQMFDQPPEAGMGQRMSAAMEGGGEAFANAPFESKAISEEARQRGVETGLAGIGADILGDPGNLAGNPIVDIAKLVTALPAAIKGGVSMAHMLPLLMKGGIEAVPEARGLFSRVDEAAKLIPPKGAHPNKVASILKSNASAEELAFRKVPEFLAAQGEKVTPESLLAHLKEHPAPMPEVKTLGVDPITTRLKQHFFDAGTRAPSTPQGWTEQAEKWTGVAQAAQRRGATDRAEQMFRLAEDATEMAEGLDLGRGLGANQPKYAQYQLPGGENYKETLLKLPTPVRDQAAADAQIKTLEAKLQDLYKQAEATRGRDMGVYKSIDETRDEIAAIHKASSQDPPGQFKSGHFSDDPNILVHTRSNERTLPTGERGRFIEEVQSDWHQKGKKQGYGQQKEVVAYYETPLGHVPIGYGKTEAEALANNPAWADLVDVKYKTEVVGEGVPDASFKETWPDLGLKQQILEAAKDPKAEWIGHTSGTTQAERYDLSKQIDELKWYRDGDGYRISAKKDGDIVAQKSAMSPQELSATVGKEMADKITKAEEQHGVMSGLDLQVGGEGMKHFYDNLLPKRLEKILKPFGGKVEQVPLGGRTKAQIDAEVDRLLAEVPNTNSYHKLTAEQKQRYDQLYKERETAMDETNAAAWIARLTPEMKARINKEGLPLAALLAALGLGGAAKTQEREQ